MPAAERSQKLDTSNERSVRRQKISDKILGTTRNGRIGKIGVVVFSTALVSGCGPAEPGTMSVTAPPIRSGPITPGVGESLRGGVQLEQLIGNEYSGLNSTIIESDKRVDVVYTKL